MSEQDRHSVSSFEEEEEAFLDMDDPNNVVVDDGSGSARDVSEGENDTSDDGEDEEEKDNVEDPIVISIEPERDDAIVTFTGVKPFHSCHASSGKIALGSEDDNVYLNEFDGKEIRTTLLSGHSDTVTSVAISPNGTSLATAGMDCVVHLWDLSIEGAPLKHKLSDLSGEIQSLLWHPSGMVVVAGGSDAQVAMWNAAKGTLAQYFVGHRDAVNCLAWSADVKKLITGGADSNVIVFNPKTAEAEKTVAKDISAGITALEVINNDNLMVGCEDGGLQLVSVTAGKVVKSFEDIHDQAIERLAKCATNPLLAACSCDCKISIWNLQDTTLRITLRADDGITRALWIGPIVVGSTCNGCVHMWDGRQASDKPIHSFIGHRAAIMDMSYAEKDGERFIVTASDDSCMKIFQVPSVLGSDSTSATSQ